jgi:hypothetical protein
MKNGIMKKIGAFFLIAILLSSVFVLADSTEDTFNYCINHSGHPGCIYPIDSSTRSNLDKLSQYWATLPGTTPDIAWNADRQAYTVTFNSDDADYNVFALDLNTCHINEPDTAV